MSYLLERPHMSIKQTTAPSAEPVTTTQAKTHMRVDTSDDDTYIDTLVSAARSFCENFTGRQFVTATWTWKMDRFPSRLDASHPWRKQEMTVPRPPLASVSSITYVDVDGAAQTWSSSLYDVDSNGDPGRIVPTYGEDFPGVRVQNDAVTVVYTAGYGGASDVPQEIKQAILLLAAHWYENREASIVGVSASTIPLAVDSILWNYRLQEVW